jgi:DNA sulfur modification protein DndC
MTQTPNIKINDTIQEALLEIKQAYLYDSRPWILGYSGGKDSTTTLQLVWNALLDLSPEERTKPIYVISSDTLVETPLIEGYLLENVDKINHQAKIDQLPITSRILTPITDETFWVNLIGRGYPAPNQMFRWCTNRLKIKTSTRFIQEQISTVGEVVIVLGTRVKESGSRAQVMKKLDIQGSIFARSNQFSAAFSYSPIRDWSSWDVWQYLMKNKNPWAGDNQKLAQMYRDAEGECPFVVDDKSPPCGNSRFGCWICTLVETDKSLQALIVSGFDWLQPLLNYRNYLVKFHNPILKPYIRGYKVKRGQVFFKRTDDQTIIRGPFYLWFRQTLLHYLLWTEQRIRTIGPDPKYEIIKREELERIRQIWRTEEGDWDDSLPGIYDKIYDDIYWRPDDNNPFNRYDRERLLILSEKYDVPERLVTKLIDLELQTQGMSVRSSIFKNIAKIFREEWRSEDEIMDQKQTK